jgi:hypothetical protein
MRISREFLVRYRPSGDYSASITTRLDALTRASQGPSINDRYGMVKRQPLGTVLPLAGAMTFVPLKGCRTSPAQARRAGKAIARSVRAGKAIARSVRAGKAIARSVRAGKAIARSVRAGKAIMCEPQEAREGRQELVPMYRPAYVIPCACNKAMNSAPCRSSGPPTRMTAPTRALTDPAISYRSYRTEECGLP